MTTEHFIDFILTNSSNLIAPVAVIISFYAYRTQMKALRIVSYDKKFKVFSDSLNLYQEFTHGEITKDTFSQFISSKYAARILFPNNSGVYELLDSVHDSAVSFNGCNRELKRVTDTKTKDLLYEELNKSSLHLNGFLDDLSKLINSKIEVY